MKLRSIKLSWFRGASDDVSLDLAGRSTLVYGENGSGKSSFVDALEYAISDGKIAHLRHEYCSPHYANAIPNTHRPKDKRTWLTITLHDGTSATCEFKPSGASIDGGDGLDHIRSWDCRRTILRQDEVARFISDRKGDKYSALLPLLGLDEFEDRASNIHQLVAKVDRKANLLGLQTAVDAATKPRAAAFASASDAEIEAAIVILHGTYCPSSQATELATRCSELLTEINARIASLGADSRRYLALTAIADAEITETVRAVRDATEKLLASHESLVTERLAVLTAAETFAAGRQGGDLAPALPRPAPGRRAPHARGAPDPDVAAAVGTAAGADDRELRLQLPARDRAQR